MNNQFVKQPKQIERMNKPACKCTSLKFIMNPSHYTWQNVIECLSQIMIKCKHIQWSGLLFLLVQKITSQLSNSVATTWITNPGLRWTTKGLTISTLLLWNFLTFYENQPSLLRWKVYIQGFDYAMISSNVLVSTFPYIFHRRRDALFVIGLFGASVYKHINQHRDLQTYYLHHYVCGLGASATLYRCVSIQKWHDMCLQLYGTVLCSFLYHKVITFLHDQKNYLQMKWYIPVLWHFHTALCQYVTVKIATHVHMLS